MVQVLKIIFDIVFIALGVYWFVISLLVDLVIARYVLQFFLLLRSCTPEEVQLLRSPQQMWNNASPYFVMF
jgi:hypothetical protein